MRSDYVDNDTISHILWAMQPVNRLVCEVVIETGWRVDDVLSLKSDLLYSALKKKRPCMTIVEKKTGKKSTKYISRPLIEKLEKQAGRLFVFEGRDDYRKHRTRQAVFLDIKRVAKKFNIKVNFSPHSLRKNYAVYLKHQGKSIDDIQKSLNHDNILVTMLYAMSDELTSKYA